MNKTVVEDAMDFKELFPEVITKQEVKQSEDYIIVEQDGHVLHFPKSSLTKRELYLLQMTPSLEDASSVDSQNPWYRYLVEGRGRLPQSHSAVQFIFIEHQFTLSEELKDFLSPLVINVETIMTINQTQSVMILNQDNFFNATELLTDILPTIENDFNTRLRCYFGNSWTHLQAVDWKELYEEEYKLFTLFLSHKVEQHYCRFPKMALWALANQSPMPSIKAKCLQHILDTSDTSAIIKALWQEQGNLAKTAKALFIHRNSLQYKLDKFTQSSGLNLKILDDLAYAYLISMDT